MVSLDDIMVGMAVISAGGALAMIPGWKRSYNELKAVATLYKIRKDYHNMRDSSTYMGWYHVVKDQVVPVLADNPELKSLAYDIMDQLKKDAGF